MFPLCVCYSSHFRDSRNLIGYRFPPSTLQYVHYESYFIFGMFFLSKGSILHSFIVRFIRQDGIMWFSSWHLFFLRVCGYVCALDILSSYFRKLVFVAVTSLFLLSSFQMFWVKKMTTFKITFPRQYLYQIIIVWHFFSLDYTELHKLILSEIIQTSICLALVYSNYTLSLSFISLICVFPFSSFPF